MVWVLKNGLEPEPDKIMNPSYFSGPVELGHVLARRFYIENKAVPVLVLGTTPWLKSPDLIWREWLRAQLSDGLLFDRVYTLRGLPSLTAKDIEITDLDQVDRVGRIVVQVPSTEDWRARVEAVFGDQQLSLFQVPFQIFKERVDKNPLPCNKLASDEYVGPVEFGCLARQASERYYRKRLKLDKYAAAVDRLSPIFHLVFVYEPSP